MPRYSKSRSPSPAASRSRSRSPAKRESRRSDRESSPPANFRDLIIGMESIIRQCNNYKNTMPWWGGSTTSSQILRELETSLLSSGFNDEIPSFLESFCNEDDAVKRFAAYDILVLFCRTLDITRCLTVQNLSRIILEINHAKFEKNEKKDGKKKKKHHMFSNFVFMKHPWKPQLLFKSFTIW